MHLKDWSVPHFVHANTPAQKLNFTSVTIWLRVLAELQPSLVFYSSKYEIGNAPTSLCSTPTFLEFGLIVAAQACAGQNTLQSQI